MSSARRTMKRRWAKLIFRIAAAFIGTLAIVFLVLQAPPLKRFAFERLCHYLRSSSGIDLQASKVQLDFLRGTAMLENPAIRSVNASDLPPFFRASRAEIKLGVIDLIRGIWTVETLNLGAPRIHYFVGRNGQTNLPESSKASGPLPDLLITHAEANDGSFEFRNLQREIALTLPRWSLSVNGDRLARTHHIVFASRQDSSFEYSTYRIPILSLEFSATLDNKTAHVEFAQIVAADSRFSVEGNLQDFSRPAIDLRCTSDLDLGGIARSAGLKQKIEGRISGTILARGKPDKMEFTAQLKGADISGYEYRRVHLDLSTNAEWTGGKLLLRDLNITSAEGSLGAAGEFFPGSQSEVNSIEARIRNLNLFPIWKQLKPPFNIATRGTGAISLRWKGKFTPPHINADAKLSLNASRATPELNLLPVSGSLQARMQSNRIVGDVRSLRILGAETSGQFSLRSFMELEASLGGSAENIDVFMLQLSQFLGQRDPTLVGVKMAGPFQFKASAGGKLKEPTINASVDAPSLQIGALKNLSVNTDLAFRGQQAAFQNTIVFPQDSTAMAQGTLEFGGPGLILSLEANSNRMRVASILSSLDRKIPIEGNLSAALYLRGPIENLSGNLVATGDELSLYGESMGHLEMALSLSDKEIRSTQFKLTREPSNPEADCLDAQLAYSLDSGQFQFQAEGKDLTLKRLLLPGGGVIQGTMNLVASGTGTLEQPSIDARLESSNIQAWQRSLGPVSVDATVRNEQITLEALVPRLNLSSTVLLESRDLFPFKGEMQIRNSDLSVLDLKGANGQPLTGTLEAALTGSGNLDDLAQAQISAAIKSIRLRSGNMEVHNRDPIQVEYRNKAIELLSTATIISGNTILEMTGGVPIGTSAPEGSLNLKGSLDLAQAVAFIPALEGYAPTGSLNLDIALAGTPQKMSGTGAITLQGGTVQLPNVPVPLTDINIQANIQNGSLVLEQADAAWGQGRVVLQGELPFGLLPKNIPLPFPRKEGMARFSLYLMNLRPEATGMLPKGFSGRVSLHATGQTTSADLRALNAGIEFQNLDLKVSDLGFNQREFSKIEVRNGIAFISQLSLAGGQTAIDVGGSAALFPNGPLDLRLVGSLDAALLTYMSQDLKASGMMQVQLVVAGDRNAPILSGIAAMNGGRLSLRNPRIVADSLTMRLNLSANKISIRELTGTLNGGSLVATGTIMHRSGSLDDFNLKATVQDFFLNFPTGLKSALSGDLAITSSDNAIVISGDMRALESSYRESFQLLGALRAQRIAVTGQEDRDPLLERIRLNIALRTATPLLVRNNIARVESSADLRLVGSFYEPSLVGRATLSEGGEIVLNQKTYYISRGNVTLTNQMYMEPELNIQALTRAGDYDITLLLTGTPDKLATSLTSEPPLSEADILSLLLTGKTASETRGREFQTAQTQALSLIAGQAGEEITREARQALHLSTLRIDPGLASSVYDAGARLTIGEDITRNFSLAYSMNLTNANDQTWAAQYNVVRNLWTQATMQQDNSYRFEFRHDLRLGGSSGRRPSGSSTQRLEIGSIQFQGEALFPEKTLLDKLKVKPGNKYDFPKIQKGLDRLYEFYASQKRLEADIRMRRETQQKTIDLNLNINAGPIVEFAFAGFPISKSVREKVEKAWAAGVFDIERFDGAVTVIRQSLVQAGYLQSEVTYTVETGNEKKLVTFNIIPGARYTKVSVTYSGASEISAAQLDDALDLADLGLDLYIDPQKVVDYFKRYYQERGFLQARVDLPQMDLNPGKSEARVIIPIQEGPVFTIGDLEFNGNHAFNYDELWSVIPTSSGSIYDPNTLRDAVKELENIYHSKGYNDVTITSRFVQDSKTAHAHVTFDITERRQSIIRDIVIEGNQRTSQSFVERQLDLGIGDPLDFGLVNRTRKRLYDTGVYANVDFQTEEMPGSKPDASTKDIRVRISMREVLPYRFRYGLYYDTERGPGGLAEVQNLNLFGRASSLGLKARYDSDLQSVRLYYAQPHIEKLHLKMDASAFFLHEDRPGFSADRIGFSLIQEKRLQRNYVLGYGYQYDHVRWDGLPPDPTIFQASVPVARIVTTLTRETRDSILDATRGEFSSHSLELGPTWLGSEIGFARYYGQYFRYVPLDKFLGWPTKDKRGHRIPARLIYAGALRLGLTSPFGGHAVISPERFYAGGGTTMRGFQQDLLGPTETLEDGSVRPTGGEALFLFNNELRFPILGPLHGVAFVDIGNVYKRISDFDFSVRKTAGAGLRFKIKFIPVRFDYGFKLDRRPGESAGAFFFSIGQAF